MASNEQKNGDSIEHRNGRTWNKVFEVGVQRTGSTSLGKAFELLGLRTKGWDERLYQQCVRGIYGPSISSASNYDALQDLPWDYEPILPELDTAFPNSKFIILLRDDAEWAASYHRAFGGQDHDLNIEWRAQKYQRIRTYFEDRPSDLLEYDLVGGSGWGPLCGFLDLPVPETPFPHMNQERSGYRASDRSLTDRIRSRLAKGIGRPGGKA